MPNLVYLSRGKNINLPHNFKAGALNALVSSLIVIELYDQWWSQDFTLVKITSSRKCVPGFMTASSLIVIIKLYY